MATEAPSPDLLNDALRDEPVTSVTLAQLKASVATQQVPAPKLRTQTYAYHHQDSANTREELEEFYSYSELPDCLHLARTSWEETWCLRNAG